MMLSRSRGTASLLRRKSAMMASRSTPMDSSTSATVKPVRSLPAKQCAMTGRSSANIDMTCRTAVCAPGSVGKRSYSSVMKRLAATLTSSSSGFSVIIRSKDCSCGAAAPASSRSLADSSWNGSRCTVTPSGTSPGPRRSTSRGERRSATSVMPRRDNAARPPSSSPLSSLDRKNRPGRIPASSAISRKFHAPDRASVPVVTTE